MRAGTSTYSRVKSQRGFEWAATNVFDEKRPEATEGRVIDGDSGLMDQSYRLRYQVYCVERGFLNAGDYPEQLERDEFDRYSLHVGVVDRERELMATARLITVSMRGLPLFRHCQIFPQETELYRETNRIVEVSRLCMSRRLRQRGDCAVADDACGDRGRRRQHVGRPVCESGKVEDEGALERDLGDVLRTDT
jgi:predicted GNAT family N-acyltransferase